MKKEIKIGIFGLIILFALYWGVNFLKGRDLFKSNNIYYAYYENVSGIQVTSPIVIKGISVGSVTRIDFKPEMNNMVELQLSVKSGYRIPDNSVARIASTGIIGGKAIEFDLGTSNAYLTDGSVITAETEPNILQMAGSEFDHFKQRLNTLMKNLDSALTGLTDVLETNKDSFAGTMSNLEGITGGIKDKTENIKNVIDDLNTFSSMLAGNSGKIVSVIDNLEQTTASLSEANIARTIESLNSTLAGVQTAIESEDGTLGLLLNDRRLYDSLSSASSNLSSLLADIERNPSKYVHFSLFGKREN